MEPTLLMLDEPTNHLDLNAVIWLDRCASLNRDIEKRVSVICFWLSECTLVNVTFVGSILVLDLLEL